MALRCGGRIRRRQLTLLMTWMAGCTGNPIDAVPDSQQADPLPVAPTHERLRWTDDESLPPAPVSLTASDGTGLELVRLKARGVIEGPLAFTEMELVFENPHERIIEGRFEIEMPLHAAISRFAMKVQGRWQEGEVVERQAARVAYEDFLHRRQDPALLENEAGNSFSARVFPIGPRERKEIIVSYSQELPNSAEPYRLKLRGLPQIEELDASIIERKVPAPGAATNVGGSAIDTRVIEVKRRAYTPERDLEIQTDGAIAGLRHDNLAMVRVSPAGNLPAVPVGSLTVLFDTSASRALGFDGQIDRLVAVLGRLRVATGEDFPLRVVCFDQTTQEVYSGPASGFGTVEAQRIAARRALGASNLEGALRTIAAMPNDSTRLLVVSDGIATAGSPQLVQLQDAVRALAAHGIERIDAIADGGIQDPNTLKAITTSEVVIDGVVIDARLPLDLIAHKLGRATLPPMRVSVADANWVWPETLEGVQPGDELLIYADLPPNAAMRVVLEGSTTITADVPTTWVERPLLERAWVRAQVDRLQTMRSTLPESDATGRVSLQNTIVALSTKHRVLSEFTALLVLETEQDYRRFRIDRTALADILTTGATGIEVLARGELPPPHHGQEGRMGQPADPTTWSEAPPDPLADSGVLGLIAADAGQFLAEASSSHAFAVGNDDQDVWGGLTGTEVGEAFGIGGLGLVGTGRGGGGEGESTIGLGNFGVIGRGGGGTGSGYGRGSGAGFGGRGRARPQVRHARAEVQGSLDRDLIRRVVRAHIQEVRHCYDQALVRQPDLSGRVEIGFTIAETGNVAASVVESTTVRDPAVGTCIAEAVRRWTFPRPNDGGPVVVRYPFVLTPDGEPSEHSSNSDPPTREPTTWERLAQAQATERTDTQGAEAAPASGRFFEVTRLIAAGHPSEALAKAEEWREQDPRDLLALIALGEAAEASDQRETAARAYGSIIDLYPSRADLRRYAGARLERVGESGQQLAVDTFAKAVESRPDHPSSHRLYAYALLKAGQPEAAFEAIRAELNQSYPDDRFVGHRQILREDLGLIAAAWIKADPTVGFKVRAMLEAARVPLPRKPSTRFVIVWETDANDVDFHVRDGKRNHAYYESKQLATGGELYADVTTGYGPECFAIEGVPKAFPYDLAVHYYNRGPMGYGFGKLQIVQHDGQGDLRFDERPFVAMSDGAFVDLGTFAQPL